MLTTVQLAGTPARAAVADLRGKQLPHSIAKNSRDIAESYPPRVRAGRRTLHAQLQAFEGQASWAPQVRPRPHPCRRLQPPDHLRGGAAQTSISSQAAQAICMRNHCD
eukprot:SAG25_NODE_7096_length_505_cov_0.788177_1_plen_107_part_10